MRIGAHTRSAGGVDASIDNAVSIGAECVQLFPSSPRGWGFKPLDELVVAEFKRKARENDVGPNVFHGIYLVSLGSDDPALVARGKSSLKTYMNVAADLGVMGVIFHLNSHGGRGFDGGRGRHRPGHGVDRQGDRPRGRAPPVGGRQRQPGGRHGLRRVPGHAGLR